MPRDRQALRSDLVFAPRTAITASARVHSPKSASKMIRKTGRQSQARDWQNMLWDYYDIVPEYRSAVDWVGNALSKARLEIYHNGKLSTKPICRDILASFFEGPKGQSEMLRLLGVHFTLAGEAWIVGTAGQTGDEWGVFAATEVTGDGTNRLVIEGVLQDEQALPVRLWKPHARRSDVAHSPSRAVIPVLNQIVKLSMVIDAQADSRLSSAGILWVPNEIELPSMPITINDGETTQTLEGPGTLYERLIQIASIAIEKRDSAAAQVPLVISAPGEYLEKIQKTDFWSGFDEHVKELRAEAIARIGVGMDMPPEVLTGTADVNHWGSWQIEEAATKSYTEPLLEIVVGALTKGYLHPFLEASGVADWQSYAFHADTSQMRLRPNRSKEAVELWDRGTISTRTMLIENGFDPDADGMPDDEKILWMLTKVGSGSATPDQVAAALRQLGVPGIPGDTQPTIETREARPPRSLNEHPNRTMPDPEKSEARDAIAASAGAPFAVDGLVLATEQMVFRALERAGNKLKNRVGRIDGVDAMDLYLSTSGLQRSECETLLGDAWRLDRFDYPGIDKARLQRALHSYTVMLLRMQKPYSRAALARHLMLELSEEAA